MLFLNSARNNTLCVAAVAITWLLFFRINASIFSHFEKTQFVNLVFIPAGVRLVAVLLFDELGVLGLFIGALMTSPIYSTHFTEAVLISLVSALNPYFAIHITKRLLKIDHLLNQLRAKELILMGLFSGLFNCLSHHYYFRLANLRASWEDCENMFIGDILGISITLTLFIIILKLIRKYSSTSAKP